MIKNYYTKNIIFLFSAFALCMPGAGAEKTWRTQEKKLWMTLPAVGVYSETVFLKNQEKTAKDGTESNFTYDYSGHSAEEIEKIGQDLCKGRPKNPYYAGYNPTYGTITCFKYPVRSAALKDGGVSSHLYTAKKDRDGVKVYPHLGTERREFRQFRRNFKKKEVAKNNNMYKKLWDQCTKRCKTLGDDKVFRGDITTTAFGTWCVCEK